MFLEWCGFMLVAGGYMWFLEFRKGPTLAATAMVVGWLVLRAVFAGR